MPFVPADVSVVLLRRSDGFTGSGCPASQESKAARFPLTRKL
jgi:hypothetical protein